MKTLPSYYVVNWDFNTDSFKPYDIMPTFLEEWKERFKENYKMSNYNSRMIPKTFEEFKYFIKDVSFYYFWSKCECECIIHGWPVKKNTYKLDFHDQVMMNIDVITKLFMDYICE